MGRAARIIRDLITGLLFGLLSAEVPHVRQPRAGVQAPDVNQGLDREHADRDDRAFVALTERMEVAAAVIPPPPPFVPAPEFPFIRYNRAYRRYPALYMQPTSDAPILWYAAEQAKAASE